MIRISTNERYQPASWWREAFLRRDTCPMACRPLILAMLREWDATVTIADADAFKTWGEKITGWNAGPTDAPHPFTFSPVQAS